MKKFTFLFALMLGFIAQSAWGQSFSDITGMEAASSFADVQHWYTLTIHTNKFYLKYEAGQSSIALGSTTLDASQKDAYAWAFIDNGDGTYKIVNKAAGADYVLSNKNCCHDGNTGGSTYPHLAEEATLASDQLSGFSVLNSTNISGANGFYIGMLDASNNTIAYMNKRGDVLAYWNGGKDAGSTFIATEILSAREELAQLITSLSSYVGTNPGYYPQSAIDAAQAVVNNASATDDALIAAKETLQASYIKPVAGKTYLLVSAYPEYMNRQGVEKAMYNNEDVPGWKTLNVADASFYWYVQPYGNGYSIQSMSDSKYVSGAAAIGDTETEATLRYLGQGQFNIICDGATFHTNQHGSGAGAGSNIVSWGGNNLNTADAWYIREATLQTAANFNYIYQLGGKSMTVPVEGVVGQAFPAPTGHPYGTTAATPAGTVAAGQADVTITLTTENFPFQYAASAAEATHWYTMDIHSNEANYIVSASDDAPTVANENAYNEIGVLKSDYYRWAFIGDPITGFQIYNAGAQKSMTQPEDNDVQITLATTGDNFRTYAVTSRVENGIAFKIDGRTYYINHRGDKLQGWTATDEGSSFRVHEIDMEEQEQLKQQANFTEFDAMYATAQTYLAKIGTGAGQYTDPTGDLADFMITATVMNENKASYNATHQGIIDQTVISLQNAIDALVLNQPTAGKLYRLQGVANSRYLTENGTLVTDPVSTSIVELTADGKLKFVASDKYLVVAGGDYTATTFTSNAAEASVFNFAESGARGTYNVSTIEGEDTRYLFGWTYNNTAVSFHGDENRSRWIITETDDDVLTLAVAEAQASVNNAPGIYTADAKATALAAITAATSVADVDAALAAFYPSFNGAYRIYGTGRNANKNYLNENSASKLVASEGTVEATKVWVVEYQNPYTFTIKNNSTGRYIQLNPGQSTQFSTGTTAAAFPITDTSTENAFNIGTSGYNFMHEAGGHDVVGWEANAGASVWFFEPVTEEELALDARVEAATVSGYTQLPTIQSVLGLSSYDSSKATAYTDALSAYESNKSEATCAAVEAAAAALVAHINVVAEEMSTKYYTLQNQRVPYYAGVRDDNANESWCGDETAEVDGVWQFVYSTTGVKIYNVSANKYLAPITGGSTSTTALVAEASAGVYTFIIPTEDTEKDGKTLVQINDGGKPAQAESAGYLNWWYEGAGEFNARWAIEAAAEDLVEAAKNAGVANTKAELLAAGYTFGASLGQYSGTTEAAIQAATTVEELDAIKAAIVFNLPNTDNCLYIQSKATGRYLAVVGEDLTTVETLDNTCLWQYTEQGIRNAATGLYLDCQGKTAGEQAYAAAITANEHHKGSYVVRTNSYYCFNANEGTIDRGGAYNNNVGYAWDLVRLSIGVLTRQIGNGETNVDATLDAILMK